MFYGRKSFSCFAIPAWVLDELAVRFLINIPKGEKQDMVRICFQLEQAHWFYIEHFVDNNPELSNGTMLEFASVMFQHVPFLQQHRGQVKTHLSSWLTYKLAVPVFGCIILNKELNKVLLVQGFKPRASWTFPKGKVNECEAGDACAAREVLEETGCDVTGLIDKKVYLERVVNKQTVRLFIVTGVGEQKDLAPRSRGEIRNIAWWNLWSLPTSLADKETKLRIGLKSSSFFNVVPYMNNLRLWVQDRSEMQKVRSLSLCRDLLSHELGKATVPTIAQDRCVAWMQEINKNHLQ